MPEADAVPGAIVPPPDTTAPMARRGRADHARAVLPRVLQMPVTEVVGRGRQEVWKWLDRVTALTRPAIWRTRVVQPRARPAPARFFTGAENAETVAQAVARIPRYREEMLAIADALCHGRFNLMGYRGLTFGDPVDWHLDPISGRRAPWRHWSRLDPLDPAAVGDSKVVWELNRHQWLLSLGQAYRLTGDERYAEAFAQYVREWMRANPIGLGINWASSLEVALRLISWCWALELFCGSPALSGGLFEEMLLGIEAHARHVERYLSLYFAPNTHLTGEALGLFYTGVLFPDLRRARRWEALGKQILVTQCDRQILPDGVYFEQSTCYQRYTAEIYLHFLILAARNGIDVPDTVADRLQRLLDFLLWVRRPDGSMPLIGDADGGWLLPFTPRGPDDLRGVFAVAAAFFRRSDYAWAAGGLAPEVLWLLGPAGAEAFAALIPVPPATAPSRLFREGGYAVMQTGWMPDAHQLVFDLGPRGSGTSGSHWHVDLLGIQCAVFGQPYVVDPGMYSYADPQWREYCRGTAAHSTVVVDGQPQAVRTDAFAWPPHPRARLRRWCSSEVLDVVDAEHDAYHRLPDPVTHRRRAILVKPRYWVVVDDLIGTGEHRMELLFQFAPMAVTVDPDRWARACGRRGHSLLIRSFSAAALTAEVCEGQIAPPRGWVSPDYGQRRPAPVLTYSTTALLPLRVVTFLLPVADSTALPPRVSVSFGGHPDPAEIVFEDTGETLIVGDEDVRLVAHSRGRESMAPMRVGADRP